MTPTPHSTSVRGLTWLLAVAFIIASVPAPVFAQAELAPPDPMGNPVPPEGGVPPPEGGQPPPDMGQPPPDGGPGAAVAEAAPASPSPAESARARIQRLREARAAAGAEASAAVESGGSDGGAESSFVSTPAVDENGEELFTLAMKDSPLDVLLDRYSQLTGRTMIKAPGANATFTFKAQKLTREEMIQAMDSLLTMNNLTLVPLGSRFYRVVQTDKAPADGLAIQKAIPEGGHPDSDALVSQLVGLEHLEMEDAVNIVQTMLHGFGKVQRFDRIRSLLVTETSSNLRRIYEILDMVDQPTKLDVDTRFYQIKYAKASEIAARLNELISDSQAEKKEEVAQVAAPAAAPRRPASMIRARQPAATPEAPVADTAEAIAAAMAQRGIIQGKVKMLVDERTNLILVISHPSNFDFFDWIVGLLDVSVDPEVIVQVVALEFADAEEMSSLLNDFIGAAKSESDTAAPATGGDAATDGRARALEDFVRARAAAADRVRQAAGETAASKIGQLSANTKILADKRTNTLLLMGTKGDIATLQDIVKKVDIMLAQVLIEAVILEVNLNNTTAYGVNWLQKSMTAYSQTAAGQNGGVSLRDPVASWGGAFGQNDFTAAAGDTISRAYTGASGLKYFFTFANLNMDMVLSMVASSGEGRVLATPVILTTDNTEASIISGQSIPIRTGDTSEGGTVRSDYEFKDVGIELKVTPRINPSRYVTLEITQSANTLGEPVDVGNDEQMTSINKREMQAMISVPSRSTIVLGGLVQTDYQGLNSRVPLLGSIPLLGALFRSENKTRKRTELLVLITPYVLMTPDEARLETERLHRSSNVAAEDWYRGWSDSSLAPFSPTKLKEMKQDKKFSAPRAQVRTADGRELPAAPPVALIEPADPMPKPTPDAKAPEEFGQEVERMMSGQAAAAEGAAPELEPAAAEPLPAPAEPTTTAPYVFDPAVPPAAEEVAAPEPPVATEPEPQPAPKPKRSLWGTKVKKEEPKPSMFPAPDPSEAPDENGENP